MVLTGVHEVVLLEVGELGEALGADVALERPLAGVRPQVDLEVRELSEGLAADVALVVHLAVLLLERVGQGPVAPGAALGVGAEGAALGAGVLVGRHRADRRVPVDRGRRGGDARVYCEARVVAQVEVVGAGDQRLVAVHLQVRLRAGAGHLAAAAGLGSVSVLAAAPLVLLLLLLLVLLLLLLRGRCESWILIISHTRTMLSPTVL